MESTSDVQPAPPVNQTLLSLLEPVARWVDERYFRAEVKGLERIPDGPALLVANHNAGLMTPDSIIFYRRFWANAETGEVPVFLAHQILFQIPLVSRLVQALGITVASEATARRAFFDGRRVMVYPGGDWETMRPSRERDRIDFGGRMGFVKLAMEGKVPIVPVVIAGAHDGWYVLTRGDRIACALKLDRLLRVKVFPIALGLPTGLIVAIPIFVPLPRKIMIEVLEPISVKGDPEDQEVLEWAYEEITSRMQACLDELAMRLPQRQRKSPGTSLRERMGRFAKRPVQN